MLLDILKRPINVGDIVITKDYASSVMNYVTTVIKVNRTTISVAATKSYWSYDAILQKHNRVTEQGIIRRKPHECAVVTEQLIHNRATYPEFCI